MIITVASGKGGTGKTSVAVSMALSLATDGRTATNGFPLFLDCDVEEPNAALFLRPTIQRRWDLGQMILAVDLEACTYCGRCAEVCQYHAIAVVGERVLVFPELCHGCGSCTLNCRTGAIHEVLNVMGTVERGWAGTVGFGQGTMNVGQPMAVPTIRQLEQKLIPLKASERPIILDASPGAACPVIESMRGADFVLLVTEPTPFRLHDLRMAVEVARDEMGLPVGVVINKADLNPTHSDEIEAYCAERGVEVVGWIPYDTIVTEAMVRGLPVTAYADGAVAETLGQVWQRVKDALLGEERDVTVSGWSEP